MFLLRCLADHIDDAAHCFQMTYVSGDYSDVASSAGHLWLHILVSHPLLLSKIYILYPD